MSTKPVIPRAAAVADVDAIIEHYLDEAGPGVALRFVDALEATFERVARHPASGSSRYGHELALPGLRHVPVAGFPQLVFYVELAEHVDVWRVLHGARDIPAWLSEGNG